MRQLLTTSALALVIGMPQLAGAYSAGITDSALLGGGGVTGCLCHSSPFVPPDTPTQVLVTGLPETWAAGEEYMLRVFVLGVPLPTSDNQILLPTGEAMAGFSLSATAGTFEPVDGHVRVEHPTECLLMERQHQKQVLQSQGLPLCAESGCAVREIENRCPLYDPSSPYCQSCDDAADTDGSCRPCDGIAAVSAEATHTRDQSGIEIDPSLDPVVAPRTDGNNRVFWDVKWVPPTAGSGTVRFNVAGNVVNGNGVQDFGDVWNFGDRVYVCEAGAPCPADGSGGHEH